MTIDVTDFQRDVIDKSFQAPVVVDFWAAWCAPCRVLGPVLERLAEEAAGAWILAKLDTEALPDVAAGFGIRGIPTVKLFVDGRSTAEFSGALPEPAVQQWLKTSLPDKHQASLDHAEALFVSGQSDAAFSIVEATLALDPTHLQARILGAQILLFDDPSRATSLLEGLEEDVEHFERIESVRILADLLKKKQHPESLPEGVSKDAYVQALRAVAQKDFDAALERFIRLIREDRYYDDDGARKACIAIFKYLGEGHDVTLKHRREFSSALY